MMKDHVQSCHLTKFDDLGVNRAQVIDLGDRMTRFYSCHKTDNKFLEFIWFWGVAASTLQTFVWILNNVSRSKSASSV